MTKNRRSNQQNGILKIKKLNLAYQSKQQISQYGLEQLNIEKKRFHDLSLELRMENERINKYFDKNQQYTRIFQQKILQLKNTRNHQYTSQKNDQMIRRSRKQFQKLKNKSQHDQKQLTIFIKIIYMRYQMPSICYQRTITLQNQQINVKLKGNYSINQILNKQIQKASTLKRQWIIISVEFQNTLKLSKLVTFIMNLKQYSIFFIYL